MASIKSIAVGSFNLALLNIRYTNKNTIEKRKTNPEIYKIGKITVIKYTLSNTD